MSEELRLNIAGMTCSACAISVEKIISNQPNVVSVSVNLALTKALIQVESIHEENIHSLIEAINQGGFEAERPEKTFSMSESAEEIVNIQSKKALLAIVLALPTLWLTMFSSDLGEMASFDLRACWLCLLQCQSIFGQVRIYQTLGIFKRGLQTWMFSSI